MPDASQNEQLLAALIDGELSGDERRNAEKLLNENPQYQKLVQSWRDQSAGIRELPKYKLDEGFAFRVMRDAIAPAVPSSPATKLVSNWKMGFAAIATLAAMLLLTLFVFPKMSGVSSVADNDAVESEDADSEAKEKSVAGLTRPQPGSDVMNSLSMGGDQSREGDGQAYAENAAATKDAATGAAAGNPTATKRGNSRPQVAANSTAGGGMSGGGISQAMDPGGRPGPRPQVNTAPTKSSKPANDGSPTDSQIANRMEEGMPGPNRDGGRKQALRASRPANSNTARNASSTANNDRSGNPGLVQQNTIDQVLLINMQDREQPLEELEKVFARNSIQLSNSDGEESGSNVLSSQSQSGVEAVYVVTTKDKLKQAILELSTQAQISGYQVPQSDRVGEQQTKAAITADDGTAPMIDVDESVSSAQRLQSFNFSANSKADYEVKDGTDLLKGSNPGDNPAAEIAEIDKWFKLAGSESELNRYLLLIQTSASDSSPAKSLEK